MSSARRRATLLGVLGLIALGACADPPTDLAPAGLDVRLLGAATVRGGQVSCAPPLLGSGPDGRLVVRLEGEAAGGGPRIDRTAQQLNSGSIDFPTIPQGEDYTLQVTLCDQPEGAARYTGQARGIDVVGQQISEVPIYLLPTEGAACPGAAGAPAWPDASFAFGAAVASSDGGRALFVGGISGGFGEGTCASCAPGGRSVAVLERETGAFSTPSAQLPSPCAFARGVSVFDPALQRTRLLLLGGASEVATFGNQAEALLFLGPAPQATLAAPLWVDPDQVSVTPWEAPAALPDHLTQTFMPGVGASRTRPATSHVLVAGGISLAAEAPVASGALTLLTLGAAPRVDALPPLASPRIGPAVISPTPGVFLIIGGLAGAGMDRLAEVVDARLDAPRQRAVQVRWAGDAPPADAELARSTALPHVLPLADGRVLVVGGLPFVGAGVVARTPSLPTLYTLELRLPEDDDAPVELILDVPAGLDDATRRATRRAFAAELPVGEQTRWLVGGADPDVTQDLRPSSGVLQIDLQTGAVTAGPEHPWRVIGAAGARLWGGTVVEAGGVLEVTPGDPSSSIAVSNAAVLRADLTAASRRCGPLGDALAAEDDDAGLP